MCRITFFHHIPLLLLTITLILFWGQSSSAADDPASGEDLPFALLADSEEAAYQAELYGYASEEPQQADQAAPETTSSDTVPETATADTAPEATAADAGPEAAAAYPGIEADASETDNLETDNTEMENSETTESALSVEKKLAELTTAEKVAQLFVILPDSLTGVYAVTGAGDVTRAAYETWPVSGFIYMEDNLQSKEQVQEMLTGVQNIAMERIGLPAFTCVDEEGGRVRRISGRLEGIPEVVSMQEIGKGKVEGAREAGEEIGGYLSELGFNVDFAPVADVVKDPENSVIGSRSFGPVAKKDAKMTAAFVEGIAKTGVASTLKHFPGHGSADGDSHTDAAVVDFSLEKLRSRDLLPFISGIEAGADLVMVGHISLPKVTGDYTPASVSPKIITELLRKELGFDGVVITDALNMAAISNLYSSSEAAVRTIEAGADLILMPSDFFGAYEGVLEAVNSGRISMVRLDMSVRRILTLKRKLMLAGQKAAG